MKTNLKGLIVILTMLVVLLTSCAGDGSGLLAPAAVSVSPTQTPGALVLAPLPTATGSPTPGPTATLAPTATETLVPAATASSTAVPPTETATVVAVPTECWTPAPSEKARILPTWCGGSAAATQTPAIIIQTQVVVITATPGPQNPGYTPTPIAGNTPVAFTPAPTQTTGGCPAVGTTSNDPLLVKVAILKLQLPQIAGKPFPVMTPADLMKYFSIEGIDPALVVVDSDCTTLQVEPVVVGNGFAPFAACNPTDRRFDGWRFAWQASGTLNASQQQGFPTGLWLLEGVSFAPKPDGMPILAVSGQCITPAAPVQPVTPVPTTAAPLAACTIEAAIAKMQLPDATVITLDGFLKFFRIEKSKVAVELDNDCATIQIKPLSPSVKYQACNPTSKKFDGWRYAPQPGVVQGGQQGFPTGSWLVEGISFAPNQDGSPIQMVQGACPLP